MQLRKKLVIAIFDSWLKNSLRVIGRQRENNVDIQLRYKKRWNDEINYLVFKRFQLNKKRI